MTTTSRRVAPPGTMAIPAVPERAHRIVLSAGSDTADGLAAQLRGAADMIAFGGFGLGHSVFGRTSDASGVLSFSYTHDPAPAGSHTGGATPQT